MKALVVGVNKLYSAVQQIMNDHAKNPMEELPPSLLDEWRNVFAAEMQLGAFETWMTFAGKNNKRHHSGTKIWVLILTCIIIFRVVQ